MCAKQHPAATRQWAGHADQLPKNSCEIRLVPALKGKKGRQAFKAVMRMKKVREARRKQQLRKDDFAAALAAEVFKKG